MDPTIAIVIAAAAAIMSIAAGLTSVGTCVHVTRKFKSTSNDSTEVDIENQVTQKTGKDGSKEHTKRQKIHITNVDNDMFSGEMSSTRTGLPNKTAETLATGGSNALSGILGGGAGNGIMDTIGGLAGITAIAGGIKDKGKEVEDEDATEETHKEDNDNSNKSKSNSKKKKIYLTQDNDSTNDDEDIDDYTNYGSLLGSDFGSSSSSRKDIQQIKSTKQISTNNNTSNKAPTKQTTVEKDKNAEPLPDNHQTHKDNIGFANLLRTRIKETISNQKTESKNDLQKTNILKDHLGNIIGNSLQNIDEQETITVLGDEQLHG